MFEAILSAIRHAKRELVAKNIRGSIIIELDRREWNYFMREMPIAATRVFNSSDEDRVDSCQLEGATVRLKK